MEKLKKYKNRIDVTETYDRAVNIAESIIDLIADEDVDFYTATLALNEAERGIKMLKLKK